MRRLVPVVLVLVLAFVLFVPCAGAWTWPVGGPLLETFSFDQAHPYAAGQRRGIAIGADSGTPVLAPASGVVSFAGTVAANGKTVTIETPAGLAVSLTHLGSLAVKRDDAVAEGAVLGTVGLSGTAEFDVPYVHLGIRDAGNPQGYLDPLAFLPVAAAPVAPPTPAPPPAPVPVPAAPPVEPAAPSAPSTSSVEAPAPDSPVVETPASVPAAPAAEPPALPLVPQAEAAQVPAAQLPVAHSPAAPAPAPALPAARPEPWTGAPASTASFGRVAHPRPIWLPAAASVPALAAAPHAGAPRGVAPSWSPIARMPVSLAPIPGVPIPAVRGVAERTTSASKQVGPVVRPVLVPVLAAAGAALAAAIALLRRRGRRPGSPVVRLRPFTRFGRPRVAA